MLQQELKNTTANANDLLNRNEVEMVKIRESFAAKIMPYDEAEELLVKRKLIEIKLRTIARKCGGDHVMPMSELEL